MYQQTIYKNGELIENVQGRCFIVEKTKTSIRVIDSINGQAVALFSTLERSRIMAHMLALGLSLDPAIAQMLNKPLFHSATTMKEVIEEFSLIEDVTLIQEKKSLSYLDAAFETLESMAPFGFELRYKIDKHGNHIYGFFVRQQLAIENEQ